MTNYNDWDKKATALVKEVDELDQQEQVAPEMADNMVNLQRKVCGAAFDRAAENEQRERDAVDVNATVSFEPIVDGVSYTLKASHCLPEEVEVERSATVQVFVKKVRALMLFYVSQILYHDPVADEDLDLTSPSCSDKLIIELVPPGSSVKLVNPDVDCVDTKLRNAAAAGSTVDFSPGDLVQVVGLQAKPELNGQTGKVLRWVEEKQRWEVRLDSMRGNVAPLGLKPANLERYSKLETGFLKSKTKKEG